MDDSDNDGDEEDCWTSSQRFVMHDSQPQQQQENELDQEASSGASASSASASASGSGMNSKAMEIDK